MALELLTVPSAAMSRKETADVIGLCSDVFQLDYSYYMNLCPVRVHVLGYMDGRLVSHALWLDRPLRVGAESWLNSAYVEGVATHATYRQRGYGAAVMRRLQAEIDPYDLGALSPAVPEWYAKLGWERWLGPLWIEHDGALEATPDDEMVLIYRTPRTPTLDLSAPLTAPWRPFELW
jgi:GNAT superfamily N-acetyltransferase